MRFVSFFQHHIIQRSLHVSIVHEVINDIVCICYYNVDRPSYYSWFVFASTVTYSYNSGLAGWIIDVRQRFS